MFRRLLSSILLVALMTAVLISPMHTAQATTAGDMLFGGAMPQQATAAPTAAPETVEDETYGDTAVSAITDYQTLQLGDKDGDDSAAYIVVLQNRLKELGFLSDAADGYFGENTKNAVLSFQKLNGLDATGIADPDTQILLFSDVSALTTPSPTSAEAANSEIVRTQEMLANFGFYIGSVDGKLGNASNQAIIDFKNYVYTYDPIVVTPSPSPSPTPTPAPDEMPEVIDVPIEIDAEPTPYVPDATLDQEILDYVQNKREFKLYRETVQNGDRGDEVRRVQTRLKQLNYLYADPDGAFGDSTALALKYFQRKHGISETGIADEETQNILFSAVAQKSEEYVFPYKLYVDISDQYVYAYKWDGASYSTLEQKMICSTGKDETPTPVGTYQAFGKMVNDEWYYFKEFNCYAKWAYGIVGGILFHSVTYSLNKELHTGAVANLGKKASHGCIRLEVEAAKWIYDNCPNGTTVVIQE